jgi:hypothetical protein
MAIIGGLYSIYLPLKYLGYSMVYGGMIWNIPTLPPFLRRGVVGMSLVWY